MTINFSNVLYSYHDEATLHRKKKNSQYNTHALGLGSAVGYITLLWTAVVDKHTPVSGLIDTTRVHMTTVHYISR